MSESESFYSKLLGSEEAARRAAGMGEAAKQSRDFDEALRARPERSDQELRQAEARYRAEGLDERTAKVLASSDALQARLAREKAERERAPGRESDLEASAGFYRSLGLSEGAAKRAAEIGRP